MSPPWPSASPPTPGWQAETPAPPTQGGSLECRVDDSERSLARDQIAPLFERLETLEMVDDLAQVTRLLEPRVLPREAAERISLAATRGAAEEGAGFVP